MIWTLDHLAVTAADLEEGAAWLTAALGVAPGPGGRHLRYGTHNRLVRLGPGEYLEVIAPDPEGVAEGPRWFGLDHAGAPRLGNWIVRVEDLDAALAAFPEAGEAVAMERGGLRWRIAVPGDGSLPMGGGMPTLIEWEGAARPGQGGHPGERLADAGLRLDRLEVRHPEAAEIGRRLGPGDPRIVFLTGEAGLAARIETPGGMRWLA